MKRVLLASVGVVALVAGAISANAADLPRRAYPEKAPAYVAPIFSWTGPYIGINGGYGWGRSDFSAPFGTGNFDVNGGQLGITAGYNWQMNALVLGLEGDIDWSNIRGTAACGAFACQTKNSWLGTIRGRLGYAAGMFMPYVTGGLAVGDIGTNVTPVFGGSTTTKAGWTLGLGVEASISRALSAKLEYLYVDLGRGGTVPVVGGDASFRANLLRVGLNYHF